MLPIEPESPEYKALGVFTKFLHAVSDSGGGEIPLGLADMPLSRQWQREMVAEILAFYTHRSVERLRDNVRKLQIVL
ncbi:hypothetical protein D9M68_991580 [compost metagenome]